MSVTRVPATARLTVLAIALTTVLVSAPASARPPHLEHEVLTWEGPTAPWRTRMRRDDDPPVPNGQGLIDLSRWPSEPASPADITVEALASALDELCGSWMPRARPARYAAWILEHSAHFEVDPLLVTGLIISRSKCKAKHKTAAGLGLSLIHDKMHWAHLRQRVYRYSVFTGTTWEERELELPRFPFTRRQLSMPEGNIYFTAALLRIAIEQCPHNDGAFASVPHRHPVSHVIWGDRVRGTDGEDRVLRIRRMIIEHITGVRAGYLGRYRDLPLVSPLDGAPRKLTSVVGDPRDGGRRKHAGIDFASYIGEPVRAVADGVVKFAGIGGMNISPAARASIAGKPMGKAGIYIKLEHPGDIVSAYMHLTDVVVERGQRVVAGQLIGHVGRTGIRASSAHLHFELRYQGERVDPGPPLGDMVIGPMATWRGVRMHYQARKKRRRRHRRQ